ncbi:DNA helicase/exodeoxyribonuclease V, subunit B [Polynucleobacter meluiroseus]|uniref:DNA helicase/exodeoxyribonuclease V, subunit B n=1 Tax=Polynucleobacter meluiroseus TaxID=1938814 RepID=A0A240E4P6_9BURK|nr:PD-(D/E)XK nuclease family protein [Polynucleobacter meluiroseus]SNX29486.1 DNA helicase/exodeoxyribonuclease V, subunit B [Polynucleobacter meluiroseus]
MPKSFPVISQEAQVQSWSIAPDATALEQLAAGIWSCAGQASARPIVVLSTAGPLIGVRAALEKYRPKVGDIQPQKAFLPQVMSFGDWLEAAPGIWRFPQKPSDLERWISVYVNLRKHPQLKSWFKAESDAGAWGLAQSVIAACDILSEAMIPQLHEQLNQLIQSQALDSEAWIKALQVMLDRTIAQAYPALSRKVVDQESEVLLTFWRYLSGVGDGVFRKHFAMAAYLGLAQTNQATPRPLIWVETADPKPIDHEVMERYLSNYAQYAPVIKVTLDWQTVALWPEALAGNNELGELKELSEEQASQVKRNLASARYQDWRLLSARRFEELAWAATQAIEAHLIAGKKNIALVAQDRLAARRARALLSRLGPALNIRDETGWKLDTTRAAAALNSWLELIRAPKEGPTASALLAFLQNPYLDIAACIQLPPEACIGLVAQLEDILIASQAKSGWETFYMAIERANVYAGNQHNAAHEALLKVLQFIRARHYAWQELNLHCANAYAMLQKDLEDTGIARALEKDSAGQQLLETMLSLDLHSSDYQFVAMRLPEWISLIKTVMEGASYAEAGKEAQATLSILPLSSTRLRSFDAVVVVGCDEQQLPAFSEPPLFFSDALNRLLRASTITAQYVQQARDFSQLLVSCASVDLLWQSKSKSGEPLRPSAWIQRLQAELPSWKAVIAQPTLYEGKAQPIKQSVTTLAADLPMPLSMSPSAYKALRDCPYKYYVRSLLGLRAAKEFEDGFDASLAGQSLHALLRNFYQALKTEEQQVHSLVNADIQARREWMEQALLTISEKEFKRLVEGDRRVLGTLRDWQKQIPSFVDWQLQREADGWRYHNAEQKVGFDLHFIDVDGMERMMRIEGRADRFDINVKSGHSAEVIDYKNQSMTKMKKRSEHVLDDPQLLIYARAANENPASAHLQDHEIKQAEWVSLKADVKRGKKAQRSLEVESVTELMPMFSEQLTKDIEKLWSRKPLAAFAPDGVCQYCEARGICRKGMW